MTTTDATTTITRARCDGHPGYNGGRKHLIDLDRLINVQTGIGGRGPWVTATGPCPVCGAGWTVSYGDHAPAAKSGSYTLVGVQGTTVATKRCSAACLQSASAECKCSCGGMAHGMRA